MFINEVANNAELSAIIVNELRDLYGIKFRKEKKLKTHQHLSHKKIFGVPLNNLEFTEVKLSSGALCRIPIFVSDACARIMDQIEVEGIFRKAGSQIRQKEIREKLELGIPLDDSCNVIDIASILKYFFRELPEPLLPPGNFQETILRCLLCKGTTERKITAIQMVCLLLPNTVLNTLVYFMQFLNLVSLHSTANKMSTKNLAIIFAPGLMPVNENFGQRLNSHVQIIEILIDNAHEIGIIPSEVMNRIPGRVDMPKKHVEEHLNFTLGASAFGSRRSMDANHLKVPDTDIKKKKKRRSGSLTRMFNGFRKIVSAIGSSENLDDSHHDESEIQSTPCINKSKKRKALEASAFSSKKKKDVLALLPSGGILPSTPMECTKNKPAKKSRLSLGGKRYSKNSQQTNQNQSNKSSIKQSLERRWSFMVASTVSRDSQKPQLNTIQDTVPSVNQKSNVKVESWESQMTKSEYEEIKGRVAAIETRISKEFTKLQSSLANNSIDSVDTNDTRNGPERVLEKFERTIEETEMMNTSPLTEQLAKQLSRGLKIRSSTENRVFRSPSARKIGSIRRKSQENVRLSRNKSWHLGSNVASPIITHNTRSTRKSPLQPAVTMNSPNVDKHIQIPRANLKRGQPNTFRNGLRSTQQPTNAKNTVEPKLNSCTVTNTELMNELKDQDFNTDLKNEQWVCADTFFAGACKTPSKTPSKNEDASRLSTSRNGARVSVTKVKPARKRLNMSIEVTPTNPPNQAITPHVENKVSANDTMKTPMLPPRLTIVKKTPALKTPHALVSNRSVFTPLWQEEQHEVAGRASIARLRNQNAGMVMAKAKLFDGLVIEQPHVKKAIQITKSNSSASNALQCNGTPNDSNDPENRSDFAKSIRHRLNQATRNSGTNSPRRNKVPLNGGVNRRQHLRAQRHTPIKKTPINFDKSLVQMAGNSGGRISRNTPSPAIQSPMTRRMASIDATPNAKSMNLVMKPPRRIITPQNKQKF